MCEGWDHGLLGYGREAKKGKRRRVEGCVRVLGGLRKLGKVAEKEWMCECK